MLFNNHILFLIKIKLLILVKGSIPSVILDVLALVEVVVLLLRVDLIFRFHRHFEILSYFQLFLIIIFIILLLQLNQSKIFYSHLLPLLLSRFDLNLARCFLHYCFHHHSHLHQHSLLLLLLFFAILQFFRAKKFQNSKNFLIELLNSIQLAILRLRHPFHD